MVSSYKKPKDMIQNVGAIYYVQNFLVLWDPNLQQKIKILYNKNIKITRNIDWENNKWKIKNKEIDKICLFQIF